MTVIRITNFGGLKPGVNARALPDANAQVAENIDPTTSEFRPLATDTQVVASTGVTDPLTLHRLDRKADGSFNTDMTTGWIVKAADMNWVRGQDNADTTERTYASFNDGSAPARVYDVNDTATGRQLGVPKPETAPAAVVNTVDEFTIEDRATELEAARLTAVQAVLDHITMVWRGAPRPGTSTTGYVDRLTTYGFPETDFSQQVRVYRLSGAGGTISDPYVSGADGANFSWAMDPGLAAFNGTANGTPSWSGAAGTPHICIPYTAYGETYDLDASGLTTALAAIAMPGTTDGSKLFTSGQVAEIVAELQAYADPEGERAGPMLDALSAKVSELQELLDGGSRTSLVAITEAFYSNTDVADAITTSIANFAKTVFDTAYQVAHSSLPEDYLQAGNP